MHLQTRKFPHSLAFKQTAKLAWPGLALRLPMKAFMRVPCAVHAASVKAGIDPALATTACYNSPGACQFPSGLQVTTALIVAFSGIWFLLWLHLIYRAKRHLLELPYADFKIANLFLRLQVSPASLWNHCPGSPTRHKE